MKKIVHICIALLLSSLFSQAQTARKFTLNLTKDSKAQMVCYLPEKSSGKAVIGLPGGTYSVLSNSHEGNLPSAWMNQQGIAYFVVNYRLPEGDRTKPISDVEKGIRIVRDSATVWGINPHNVGVMGFSAGGHLASILSTISKNDVRPDFTILFYPVISMDEKVSHKWSCVNFLGEEGVKDPQLVHDFSTMNAVRSHITPPAVIIAANDDSLVPFDKNGLEYYNAMRKAGNDCEKFVYPTGNHGFGFGTWFKYHDKMLTDLGNWLKTHPAPKEDAIPLAQTKQKELPKNQPYIQQQSNAGIDLVDTEIPVISRVNKNTFAIIIANEDYQSETKVDFAKNDGEVFKNYCHKTLGLPEKNVHFVTNATLNNLIGELDWLQQVCDAFSGDASVIFYYAGHGIPDEASGSAYLLPTDGNSRLLRTCFGVNELYETLGKLPAKKVMVLMDACFSGAKRNGGMLASARGVAIKTRPSAPKGSMIVLSAAQGNETAYKYDDAKHGLFTYFLLKKLKDSNGNVTMGELSNYITEQVKRYSIVENGKSQTPTVQISNNLRSTWESLKFD